MPKLKKKGKNCSTEVRQQGQGEDIQGEIPEEDLSEGRFAGNSASSLGEICTHRHTLDAT